MNWWQIAFLTLGVAVVLPGLISPVLHKLNMVDVPNHRSSHTNVTLRGGGLAVAGAVLIGGVVALAWGESSAGVTSLAWSLFGAIGIAALGFAEDLKGLPVAVRMVGQFLLSALVGGGLASAFGWPLFWALPLALVGVFTINAANFMDGVNGISALHGITLGLAAMLVGARRGDAGLLVVGAVISASFAGFLPWNFPKAKLFLGDVGSYLLGALYLGVGVWIFAASGSLLLAIAPLAYYGADVLLTLAVRARRREKLTEAHRDHLYQQLQRKEQSHVAASLISSLVTVLLIGLAYFSWTGPLKVWLAAGLGLVMLVTFAVAAHEDAAPENAVQEEEATA